MSVKLKELYTVVGHLMAGSKLVDYSDLLITCPLTLTIVREDSEAEVKIYADKDGKITKMEYISEED